MADTSQAKTATQLYQAALADVGNVGSWFGAARHTLPNGDEIICSVKKVAGRSIVAKHFRTTWHLVPAGDQFSKQITSEDARDAFAKAEGR